MSYGATINELDKIKQAAMTPAGAVQQPGEEKRGNGLWDSISNCGPAVACPTIGVGWYVPIEPGNEAEFLKSIAQRNGYTITSQGLNGCARLSEGGGCSISGKKVDFQVGIDIQAIGPQTPHPPTTDISPKIWRDVGLRITAN